MVDDYKLGQMLFSSYTPTAEELIEMARELLQRRNPVSVSQPSVPGTRSGLVSGKY